jgi:hypothetical protein
MDNSEDIKSDTAISPFASDVYRASIFYQRHIDFACHSALSFVLVFAQEHPRLQLSLTLGILVFHTTSVLFGRPYSVEASFNHIVRICANFVAMMGAVASFLSYRRDGIRDAEAPSNVLEQFSYFMMVLCICLALLFVISFFFTLVKGAKLDHERELKRTKGNRTLVSSSLSASTDDEEHNGETRPTHTAKRKLQEGASIPPVQTRKQRVRTIRLDLWVRAKLGGGQNPADFTARSPGKRAIGLSQSDSYISEWVTNGLDAQVNPLFVNTETENS